MTRFAVSIRGASVRLPSAASEPTSYGGRAALIDLVVSAPAPLCTCACTALCCTEWCSLYDQPLVRPPARPLLAALAAVDMPSSNRPGRSSSVVIEELVKELAVRDGKVAAS